MFIYLFKVLFNQKTVMWAVLMAYWYDWLLLLLDSFVCSKCTQIWNIIGFKECIQKYSFRVFEPTAWTVWTSSDLMQLLVLILCFLLIEVILYFSHRQAIAWMVLKIQVNWKIYFCTITFFQFNLTVEKACSPQFVWGISSSWLASSDHLHLDFSLSWWGTQWLDKYIFVLSCIQTNDEQWLCGTILQLL